jgi:2-oxoglutarate ferredoxin oxidoreductase subunit alpha
MAEVFNLTDKYQCPAIILSDLYISEGRFSVDPDKIDMHPNIDRGELITKPSDTEGYIRYKLTDSGISPRALPGLEGYVHLAATDEHDEDSTLISDEFTNPHKRRAMVEKRARKFDNILKDIAPPTLEGPVDADVTLVGWGSTDGIINEAAAALTADGISTNRLQIKWMVPFHGEEIMDILSKAKRTIIIENNFSGQFARYMRSETGFSATGHIRKYDGEPFMPHHIVDGVKAQVNGDTDKYVPYQEITV